jgi:hypothetical protein
LVVGKAGDMNGNGNGNGTSLMGEEGTGIGIEEVKVTNGSFVPNLSNILQPFSWFFILTTLLSLTGNVLIFLIICAVPKYRR